ncbi:PepSY domain-containing protein [Rhodovulum sp. BSW8]|uniref:PepSY domain-containing protein n=1 Tax=Rhodovulum visakhapatnamense TaxID=364297 RepID=A0ABS1RCD4_9RHOB|nr:MULTISPECIES: hypothetical protein [Rhodovulum]MBL3569323.1 PepSY domain-containing protein [Rhodovulum visakhapatnamense]MBL3577293.1 PepSY domain-containing protein [Rhodovulum visakhapatnamense]OLS45812.1 hypothetical protein BV509_16595 [Rhodovulum sulfidophilum]RBO51508.1 PepSY domain-containing protein [Rhodovulum sp. BSW8]
MIRPLVLAALLAPAALTPALADEAVPAETAERIMAMLTDMQCEMDPADIEAEDNGGFELDDVFCADGQYDIDLNADLEITERRKE